MIKRHWCYRYPITYTIMLWSWTFIGFAIEVFLLPFNVVSIAGEILLEKMNICYHPFEATKLLWKQVKEMNQCSKN